EEAGQEPAAGLEDRRQDLYVFRAARGIDGAVAGVLPDPVEEPGMAPGQSEHVKVLEGDVDRFGRGQIARDAEDRRDEADAPIALSRDEPRVVTAAAAGDRHGSSGRVAVPELRGQRRGRPTQLPAVAAPVI